MNGLGVFLFILRIVHNTFGTCRATTDRQRGKDRWWQISSPSLPVVMMVMMISSDDLYFKEGVVSNYDSCQRFEHCDNAEDHRAEVLWQQGYLWTWWFLSSQLTASKTFEKTHSKCLEKLETSTYGHQCCCYVHLCQRWYSYMFTFVKDDTQSWKLWRKYLLTGWFPLWSARSTWIRNYQKTAYIVYHHGDRY